MFIAFIIIGLPLPVLPLYVHHNLGYGTVMVGLAVGAHFLTTVCFRGTAGKISDLYGGKRSAITGILICALSGVPYLVMQLPVFSPAGKFGCILVARVLLGLGHSLLGTGNLSWGFGLVGSAHAGRVMSWTGIANFGAVALGAPLGLMFWEEWGILSLGLATCAFPLLGLAINCWAPNAAALQGQRMPLRTVFRRIWKPGVCLALHGMGYAVISAFISLYFASNGWGNAGLALTCFGVSFVLVRLVCGELPDKVRDNKLTLVCLCGETLGLLTVCLASSPLPAFVGVALTGLSCSLLFPSIGVQVLRAVPSHVRGTAVGGFTAFQDISFGLSGPLTGTLVPSFGYPSVYLAAAISAALAFAMAARFPVAEACALQE